MNFELTPLNYHVILTEETWTKLMSQNHGIPKDYSCFFVNEWV